MTDKNLVTVSTVKSWLPEAPFLDDELLVINGIFNTKVLPEGNIVTCGVFIGICLEGQIEYTIDMEHFKLEKNDIILINHNKTVEYINASPNAKMLCLFGSNEFFQEVTRNLNNFSRIFLFIRTHPFIHLPEYLAAAMRGYVTVMQNRLLMAKHMFRQETVVSLFQALIYDICDYIWSTHEGMERGANTRSFQLFNKFIALVEKNFTAQRRVGWYAENLGITSKYLYETVKTVSGLSPNEWIDKFTILELRNLLRNTSHNIGEIANIMNFPNQSFLGRYFKRHMGISPKEYREHQ